MIEGISTFGLLLILIIIFVLLILITVFVLFIYSGLFHDIADVGTGKPPFGQIIIAYKFQQGPYNESGQLFTEAAIIAPDNKTIGIYYDDPQKVSSYHLRYVVGSVLSEGEAAVDEDMVKDFTNKGFKIIHLPEVTYTVQTSFPHISTMSILIAVRKAYPRMQAYVEERKLCAHPYIEFFDGQTIHFLAPLSKQDEFYVPECNTTVVGGQGTEMTGGLDSSSNISSSQIFEETQESLDITKSSVVSNAVGSGDDEALDKEEEAVDSKTEGRNKHSAKEVVMHGDEDNEQKGKDEEEQESDDSASSFELVKKEASA